MTVRGLGAPNGGAAAAGPAKTLARKDRPAGRVTPGVGSGPSVARLDPVPGTSGRADIRLQKLLDTLNKALPDAKPEDARTPGSFFVAVANVLVCMTDGQSPDKAIASAADRLVNSSLHNMKNANREKHAQLLRAATDYYRERTAV